MNVYQISIDGVDTDDYGNEPVVFVATSTRSKAWTYARQFLLGFYTEIEWTHKKSMRIVVKDYQEGAYKEGALDPDEHDRLNFVLGWQAVVREDETQ